MLSQSVNEVAFVMFLQGMLIIPFPISYDLLVESILNTDPLPSLGGLKVLYHICPADVEFVELSVDVSHIQQR